MSERLNRNNTGRIGPGMNASAAGSVTSPEWVSQFLRPLQCGILSINVWVQIVAGGPYWLMLFDQNVAFANNQQPLFTIAQITGSGRVSWEPSDADIVGVYRSKLCVDGETINRGYPMELGLGLALSSTPQVLTQAQVNQAVMRGPIRIAS